MAVGERLGFRHVQGGPDPAVAECAEKGVGVHDRAAGRIHEQRKRLHPADEVSIDEASRLGGQRQQHHDHIRARQQAGEGRERINAVARRSCDTDELGPERREPLLERDADRSVAQDQDCGAGQLSATDPASIPVARHLGREKLGQAPFRGEDRHHDPFGDADVVDAARIAEGHAGRKSADDPVDAGREGLDDL